MSHDTLRHYIGHLPAGPAHDRLLYRTPAGSVAGRFGPLEVTSVFQPIEDRDGHVVGHHAFARASRVGAGPVPISEVLASVAGEEAIVRFDRLCRTVHALNRFGAEAPWAPLFLCLDHRLLRIVPEEHGATFQRVLSGFGVLASRVVLVLPASAAEPGLYEHVLPSYRLRNFRIAVEVAGAPAAEAARIGRLRPDFVLARWNAALRHWASVAHDTGARLLATQIEQPGQRDQALLDGADLLQGFHVGRPVDVIAYKLGGARRAADEEAR